MDETRHGLKREHGFLAWDLLLQKKKTSKTHTQHNTAPQEVSLREFKSGTETDLVESSLTFSIKLNAKM